MIDVRFIKRHFGSIERFIARNRRNMERAMKQGIALFYKQIKQNLSGPSHTRFRRNLMRQASGSGIPLVSLATLNNPFPGVLTGRMRNSVNARIESSRDNIVGRVGPNVHYARYHEFGEGVPPRPFMKPAFEKRKKEVRDLFQKALRASLR